MKNLSNISNNIKTKVAAMTAAIMAMAPTVAYADNNATVLGQLESIINTVFNLISVTLGVFGSFILIPGIIAFFKAVTDHEGGDRSAGAQKIAFGVVVILMAIAVFNFKTPILTMIKSVN